MCYTLSLGNNINKMKNKDLNTKPSNENKEVKSKASWTSRDYVAFIIGLLLVGISVIAFTGQIFIGGFFTYVFAYMFGVFYFLILALGLILGIRLLLKRSLFPIKGHILLWSGSILLLISLLAFLSYVHCRRKYRSFIQFGS